MTGPAEYELSLNRFIDAPPDVVYKVWTTRTGEWWAPKPYTTPVVDFDLRPGGRSRTIMKAPDGTDLPNEGVFLEVIPNRKIVTTDAFRTDWQPQSAFMVAIVTFEPEGAGTRYTAIVRHWSEDHMKQHEAMGFYDGWGQVATQLAALAEAEAKTA